MLCWKCSVWKKCSAGSAEFEKQCSVENTNIDTCAKNNKMLRKANRILLNLVGNAQKKKLRWQKCADKHAQMPKHAQILMFSQQKMLRYSFSAGK